MQAEGGAPLGGASTHAPADSAEAIQRRRRIGVLLGIAAFVLLADIVSKCIIAATMTDHAPIRLLGGFLTITLTRNPGAAFGLGTGLTVVLAVVATGVIAVILRTSRRLYSVPWAVVLGLLLGGASGNLVDRLFRSPGWFRGHVVDWIELPHWPVFNLADSAIVMGGLIAVVLASRGLQVDGTVQRGTSERE
jgi:signal peptidase II